MMKKEDIKSLRSEIDKIDDELLELLFRRTSIVDQIGIKKKNSSEVIDKNRESEVIKRLLNYKIKSPGFQLLYLKMAHI